MTALSGVPAIPFKSDISVVTAQATGVINPGDWLFYSGHRVMAGSSATITGYWKASGAGVAMEGSPVYTQAGRTAINTAIRILTMGIIRASGAQSGSGSLGMLCYPISTGSGVAAPTGVTGIGALWTAAEPLSISANPTGQIAPAVAKIIGVNMQGGQTAQLDILLLPSPAFCGYYG